MNNNLRVLFAANNIKPSDFAKEIGVSRGTIYRVLRGKNPSIQLAMKIAAYFGKEVSEVFPYDGVKQVLQKTNTA